MPRARETRALRGAQQQPELRATTPTRRSMRPHGLRGSDRRTSLANIGFTQAEEGMVWGRVEASDGRIRRSPLFPFQTSDRQADRLPPPPPPQGRDLPRSGGDCSQISVRSGCRDSSRCCSGAGGGFRRLSLRGIDWSTPSLPLPARPRDSRGARLLDPPGSDPRTLTQNSTRGLWFVAGESAVVDFTGTRYCITCARNRVC